MAEPNTEWGREAVSDIRGLQRDVELIRRDLDAIRPEVGETKAAMIRMEMEFVAFRSRVDTLLKVTGFVCSVFGLALAGGAMALVLTVTRLDVQVENLTSSLRASVEAAGTRVGGPLRLHGQKPDRTTPPPTPTPGILGPTAGMMPPTESEAQPVNGVIEEPIPFEENHGPR